MADDRFDCNYGRVGRIARQPSHPQRLAIQRYGRVGRVGRVFENGTYARACAHVELFLNNPPNPPHTLPKAYQATV